MNIDAHQHFWLFNEEDYGWIGKHQSVIRRDFLPETLLPIYKQNNIDACVAVQARQSEKETRWLIKLAQQHQFIKAVVGWIDLKAVDLAEQLTHYQAFPMLKGFRHVLQDEADSQFMLDKDFIQGLKLLAEFGYRYDLLILAKQLPQANELLQHLPQLPIVLDHIGKPSIETGEDFDQWQRGINTLASYQNAYCKVSGMVTETDVNNWQEKDFNQYLDVIFNAFGPERIMYGSDWPVCLLGGKYEAIKAIIENYVEKNYPQYKQAVFGGNAKTFYQI